MFLPFTCLIKGVTCDERRFGLGRLNMTRSGADRGSEAPIHAPKWP